VVQREKGLKGAIKSFFDRKVKEIVAVDHVSFEIDQGEIVGYIGPNGAGKSTTVKMLSGILYPTSGEVFVCSLSPYKNRMEHSKNIGVVFGQRTQLWWDLPVIESFELLKCIYEIPENIYAENLREFSEVLELNEILKKPVRQLSLGQKMRAEIAASLLHNPKVLFLDEPTIGLDVGVKRKIRRLITRINQSRRVTILLTTHDLQDVEELCNRIIIINKGRIVYSGTIENLKRNYGKYRVLEFNLSKDLGKSLPNFGDIENKIEWSFENDVLKIKFDNKLSISSIVNAILKKFEVIDFTIKEPSIEDIIIEVLSSHGIEKQD
jgi:ABC-2 type transport system ATP-binding protein